MTTKERAAITEKAYRIPEETISRHEIAHHPRHDRPAMNPDPDPDRRSINGALDGFDRGLDEQGEVGDVLGVVRVLHG